MFRDLIGKGVEICNINLQQGYVKEDGSLSTSEDTNHSKYVVTDLIDGGMDFLIHLNNHYFVTLTSVYDINGNFLLQSLYTAQPGEFHRGMEFSLHLPKQFKMRLSICRNDSVEMGWTYVAGAITPDQDILPEDDIMIDFYKVDRNYFDVVQSEDPSYQQALRRVNHLSTLPLYNFNDKLVNIGINYSDQNETPGRVGFEVSPYTYLTAIHNPRSVYYTEKKSGSMSQYGITYHSGTIPWFGQNCSNSVDFVRGCTKALHFARNYSSTDTTYGNHTLNADKVIPGEHCENLKPLDTLVNQHHIWIVAEIWKDASGTPRFIRCAESGGGSSYYRSTTFSVESFLSRISYAPDPYEVTRVPGVIEAAQEGWYDYVINDELTESPTPIAYNTDICTFCGDKVDFMWGNPIFLNVQRHPGWKTVEIDKYNTSTQQYEHWQSIDIRALETKQNSGDWVDVRLSQYYPYEGTEYGKYRAYCTKTNDNLFNPDWPLCKSSDGSKYWYIAVNSNEIRYDSSLSCMYAMPCKPNTTYIVYQPTSNANRLLRLAWSKNTSLDFLDGTTIQTCYNATNLTDNPDGTTSVQVTTGADAGMLFIQLGGSQYEQARNVVQLQEVDATPTTQNSNYTWYEVVSAKFKTWAIPSVGVDNYIEPIYGDVQYITYESNAGFANASLTDYYRFIQPTTEEMSAANGYINKRAAQNIPDTTFPYACVRVKGEYGYAKREIMPLYPTNYCSTSYYQEGKSIDDSGNITDNSYKNLVTITGLTEGDVYRYGYWRTLNSAYNQEPYAFYDANGDLIGTVGRFYPSSDVPPANSYWHGDIVIPAGAVTLKIGIYKDNWNKMLYNASWIPSTNYYSPEYYTAYTHLNSNGTESSDNFRNLVSIPNLTEGDTYRFSYTRVLSSAYTWENYAFIDENGNLIGGSTTLFYQPSDIPAVDSTPHWDLTVPSGAKTLKMSVLFGNLNISIVKL